MRRIRGITALFLWQKKPAMKPVKFVSQNKNVLLRDGGEMPQLRQKRSPGSFWRDKITGYWHLFSLMKGLHARLDLSVIHGVALQLTQMLHP